MVRVTFTLVLYLFMCEIRIKIHKNNLSKKFTCKQKAARQRENAGIMAAKRKRNRNHHDGASTNELSTLVQRGYNCSTKLILK